VKKLDTSSLSRFEKSLRDLPKGLGIRIAEKAAPAITALAKASFDSGEDPYGVPWAPSVDGDRVDLRDKGDLEKHVRYVANGTKIRVALGVPHAKYQIGKRPIFPRVGLLPVAYQRKLDEIVREEMGAAMIKGAA
jgi:hypothetical protein